MKKKIMYVLLATMFVFIGSLQSQDVFAQTVQETKVEQIKKAGKLVLGVSADYKPYEFHSVVDGRDTIVGFDIDIAYAIAAKLDVELAIQDMDFAGLLPALQAGRVDIVLAGMQATEERKQNVDFSVPYFSERNVFVTRGDQAESFSNAASLAGKRIGVQQGSTQERAGERLGQEVPGLQLERIPNLLDIIQQTQNKMIDGMIMSDISAQVALAHTPDLVIDHDIAISSDAAGASVALAKGQPQLLALVNDVINELVSSGQIEAFVNKALAQEEMTPGQNGTNISGIIATYWPMLLRGAGITIIIAFFSVLFGVIGGTLLAMLRLSEHKLLQMIATWYIDFIRGTPLLIQIYLIFYGLPSIGLRLPSLVAGILAMSINSTAYVAEIIRAGILAVDKGQFEAAASLGMRRGLMMKEIILPQAFKNILPALGNEFVTIIKESSILSVIAVADLMFVGNTIRSNTFDAFTPLIVVAFIYFVLTYTLSKLLRIFERRLDKNA